MESATALKEVAAVGLAAEGPEEEKKEQSRQDSHQFTAPSPMSKKTETRNGQKRREAAFARFVIYQQQGQYATAVCRTGGRGVERKDVPSEKKHPGPFLAQQRLQLLTHDVVKLLPAADLGP